MIVAVITLAVLATGLGVLAGMAARWGMHAKDEANSAADLYRAQVQATVDVTTERNQFKQERDVARQREAAAVTRLALAEKQRNAATDAKTTAVVEKIKAATDPAGAINEALSAPTGTTVSATNTGETIARLAPIMELK